MRTSVPTKLLIGRSGVTRRMRVAAGSACRCARAGTALATGPAGWGVVDCARAAEQGMAASATMARARTERCDMAGVERVGGSPARRRESGGAPVYTGPARRANDWTIGTADH